MGMYLINFLVYSMAMVGLLFVCLMVYKKTMLNNRCAKNAEELSIENALNLSQRKTLYVIKAGNEKFLIAADTERTSFLAKLNDNNITVTPLQQTDFLQTQNINNQITQKTKQQPVDYSEVMSAIRNSQRKQPVMKEMIKKLSEPILKEDN